MSAPQSDIFQKISNLDDQKKIINRLLIDKVAVWIKAPGTDQSVSTQSQLFREEKLSVRTPDPSWANKKGELIIEFTVDHDKYFAKAPFEEKGGVISFHIIGNLFKLQRRDDFRLRLPEGYPSFLLINKLKCPLLDISAGGCRVQVDPKLQVQQGMKVKGEIHFKHQPAIEMEADIIRVEKNKIIGLRFTKLQDFSRDGMHGLIMKIYRELFAGVRHNS